MLCLSFQLTTSHADHSGRRVYFFIKLELMESDLPETAEQRDIRSLFPKPAISSIPLYYHCTETRENIEMGDL
ncbi:MULTISPECIES: hypothetical protein [Photorhabdus]|uniref:hypothetical protein n=1 Tax=Photorhabdus TaxID=29487 RepID=UPI0010439884|nr:hypothetical protein [Photorhabdus khanii]